MLSDSIDLLVLFGVYAGIIFSGFPGIHLPGIRFPAGAKILLTEMRPHYLLSKLFLTSTTPHLSDITSHETMKQPEVFFFLSGPRNIPPFGRFFLVKLSSSCVFRLKNPPWEIGNGHPNGFHGPQAASALSTPPDLIRWKMW